MERQRTETLSSRHAMWTRTFVSECMHAIQLEVSLHGCLHKVVHYGLEIAERVQTSNWS
jgi:hypothetical protein